MMEVMVEESLLEETIFFQILGLQNNLKFNSLKMTKRKNLQMKDKRQQVLLLSFTKPKINVLEHHLDNL
jgi:hypothetical protein